MDRHILAAFYPIVVAPCFLASLVLVFYCIQIYANFDAKFAQIETERQEATKIVQEIQNQIALGDGLPGIIELNNCTGKQHCALTREIIEFNGKKALLYKPSTAPCAECMPSGFFLIGIEDLTFIKTDEKNNLSEYRTVNHLFFRYQKIMLFTAFLFVASTSGLIIIPLIILRENP